MPVAAKGTVVNDTALANVDAMMGKAKTRCNEVCAQREFFVSLQKSVLFMDAAAGRARSRRNFNIVPCSACALEH